MDHDPLSNLDWAPDIDADRLLILLTAATAALAHFDPVATKGLLDQPGLWLKQPDEGDWIGFAAEHDAARRQLFAIHRDSLIAGTDLGLARFMVDDRPIELVICGTEL